MVQTSFETSMSVSVPKSITESEVTTNYHDKSVQPYGENIPITEFFHNYEKINVPGDGHCFVHALVKSNSTELALDNNTILNALVTYVNTEKSSIYNFAGCENAENLNLCLNEYVYHRRYDNLFGDCVPRLISLALGIQITVFEVIEQMVWKT